MRKLVLGSFAFVVAMGLAAFSYGAQTAVSNLNMQITVTPQCSIQTTPIAWNGAWDGSAAVTGMGSVTVTCRNAGTPWNVAMDGGLNNSTGSMRSMGNTSGGCGLSQCPPGAGGIDYKIYQLTVGGTEWGDQGFANTFPAPAYPPNGTAAGSQTVNVAGEILANPNFVGGGGVWYDAVGITLHY